MDTRVNNAQLRLPNGRELRKDDVGLIPHPKDPGASRLVQIGQPDAFNEHWVHELGNHRTGYGKSDLLLPEQIERRHVFPEIKPPQSLGAAPADANHDAVRSSALLPNLGDAFRVHGDAGRIGTSWTLAVHQSPSFAPQFKRLRGIVDVNTPKTLHSAEEFLNWPGDYQRLRGEDLEQLSALVPGVQKLAIFMNEDAQFVYPSNVAVQTRNGTWLTVLPPEGDLPSRFLEVEKLDQLAGAGFGTVKAMMAAARHEQPSPNIDAAIGDLLTEKSPFTLGS